MMFQTLQATSTIFFGKPSGNLKDAKVATTFQLIEGGTAREEVPIWLRGSLSFEAPKNQHNMFQDPVVLV